MLRIPLPFLPDADTNTQGIKPDKPHDVWLNRM